MTDTPSTAAERGEAARKELGSIFERGFEAGRAESAATIVALREALGEAEDVLAGLGIPTGGINAVLTDTAPAAERAAETCWLCMQPLPLPERGDHDYGLRLPAKAEIERPLLARIAEAVKLTGELTTWMRLHLTYPGGNGTDRCHECRADLGGDYGPALPHKPDCYAAKLLDRAALLSSTATPEGGE